MLGITIMFAIVLTSSHCLMTTAHLRYFKVSFIALRTDRVQPQQKSK